MVIEPMTKGRLQVRRSRPLGLFGSSTDMELTIILMRKVRGNPWFRCLACNTIKSERWLPIDLATWRFGSRARLSWRLGSLARTRTGRYLVQMGYSWLACQAAGSQPSGMPLLKPEHKLQTRP